MSVKPPKLPTLRSVDEALAERERTERELEMARRRAVLADEAARQAQAYVDELSGRLAAFSWMLAGAAPAEEGTHADGPDIPA